MPLSSSRRNYGSYFSIFWEDTEDEEVDIQYLTQNKDWAPVLLLLHAGGSRQPDTCCANAFAGCLSCESKCKMWQRKLSYHLIKLSQKDLVLKQQEKCCLTPAGCKTVISSGALHGRAAKHYSVREVLLVLSPFIYSFCLCNDSFFLPQPPFPDFALKNSLVAIINVF